MLSPLSAYSFFPARAACQNRAALATYRRIGGLIAIIPKDWKYLRGDIYYADMEPHIGSEQGGTRPVVVLQNDVGNRYAPTLIVATVTSRTEKKRYQPTHVLITHNTAFEKPSVVQLEQNLHDRQKTHTAFSRADYTERNAPDRRSTSE